MVESGREHSGDKPRRSLSDDQFRRSLSSTLAMWLGGCLLTGAGLAWLSLRVQEHYAPLVLFPLLVGAALGAGLAWWSRANNWSNRPMLIAGVALAIVTLVVGQHVIVYLEYRRAFEQSRLKSPQLVLFESIQGKAELKSFGEFLSAMAERGRQVGSYRLAGWQVWLTWLMDAVVTAAGASAAFWFVRSGQSQNATCKG